MQNEPSSRNNLRGVPLVIVVLLTIGLMRTCAHRDGGSARERARTAQEAAPSAGREIPLPSAEQRLCTGVVILMDTSGSMGQSVKDRGGARTPKCQLASGALQQIISYTGQWKAAHPDRSLQLGLYSFSSSAATVMPMREFELEAARVGAGRIPNPGGGTAVGEALMAGFKALYQSGCSRKYLICVTDGENTAGPAPDRVARQLYAQTRGEVEIYFVAFDTSARKFAFLRNVNGHAVEAADGPELEARLGEIYEKRILAETLPAGE